jgi:hypothetical protein
MRQSLKNLCIFQKKKKKEKKSLSIFFTIGQAPRIIRPLTKSLSFAFLFHYRAGRLEQLDHLRDSLYFTIGQVTWNN